MASANPDQDVRSTPNPTVSLSHIECLSKLCIFCHGKYNLSNITEALLNKINPIVPNVLAMHNPRSICNSCRSDLDLERKDLLKHRRFRNQPEVDDLVNYNLNGPCNCGLCKKVRANNPPPRKLKAKRTGRPPKIKNSLICSKCFDDDCNGQNCQESTVKESASKLIQANPRVAQAVTAKIIKTTKPSPKGTIRLSQGSGGGQLPITLGSSAKKQKKMEVSSEQVNELSQKMGMGIKNTRQLTRFLNEVGGRGTVESGHQEKLAKMCHKLDGHFALKEECEFLDGDKKLTKKPLVYTKNLSDLVLCVINARGYNLQSTLVLFTVDNSDDFSEYYISILNLDEDPDAKQKSSGTSHILLVAVSEKVPENHFNFKTVLDIICAHEVKMLYINDLKATLILIGNQSSACKHPCPFCTTDDLSKEGEPRTIGSICEQNSKFIESGLDRKHLKDYDNCENVPLVTNDFEGDKKKEILDICPPPGLHIMLGIVNQDVKLLESIVPEKVNEWAKYSNAPRGQYHGGTFEGNGCHSLVNNVEFLEMLVQNDPNQHTPFALSIIEALRKFKEVRHSCFGKELLPDYATHLDNYSEALENLSTDHNVSIIVKNHITKFHVKTWCERNKVGLGARSEQAAESGHHKFSKLWVERFKTSGVKKGPQLLKCLCVFNSANAHFKIETICCPHTNTD